MVFLNIDIYRTHNYFLNSTFVNNDPVLDFATILYHNVPGT